MHNLFFLTRFFLCWCLVWISASSCTLKQASAPSTSPSSSAPPPSPTLEGGKMKLVVFRFENKTGKQRDESRKEDQLFGNGIKTQLTAAFKQTGQFVIGDNAGPRKVLWSRAITRSGQISRTAKRRFGSLGDAEFLLGGALTGYELSEESKAAGISVWLSRTATRWDRS